MKHGDTMKFTAIGQCSVFTKVAIVASCKAVLLVTSPLAIQFSQNAPTAWHPCLTSPCSRYDDGDQGCNILCYYKVIGDGRRRCVIDGWDIFD